VQQPFLLAINSENAKSDKDHLYDPQSHNNPWFRPFHCGKEVGVVNPFCVLEVMMEWADLENSLSSEAIVADLEDHRARFEDEESGKEREYERSSAREGKPSDDPSQSKRSDVSEKDLGGVSVHPQEADQYPHEGQDDPRESWSDHDVSDKDRSSERGAGRERVREEKGIWMGTALS